MSIALSRHVSTVLNESKLIPEEILSEQEKDQFCKQMNPGSYSSRKEFYDETALIYRRQKNDKHQLFLPRTLIRNVIRENHSFYAAHPVAKHTCNLLALSFWWPGMRKSLDFVKECDSCQRRKRNHEFTAHLTTLETQ